MELVEFLVEVGSLDSSQHGFRKAHSTETALILASDVIRKLVDEGQGAILVLLDISAAFDTVSPHLLTSRLCQVGIRERALKLLESFLTNRWTTNIFGKNKNSQLPPPPPPLPPKRNGSIFRKSKTIEEEEEDGEMYEPPPSNPQERKPLPTPRKLADDNVYAGHSEASPGRSHYHNGNMPVKLPGMQNSTCRKANGVNSNARHSSSSRLPEGHGKPAPASATDRRCSLPSPVLHPPPRWPTKPTSKSTMDAFDFGEVWIFTG
ncbi:uncharacterized protein [Pleurodeles waltl]|uniref:uncharacterized protein n=1 Tax=Pleurodeles waltl TaxID=8319 RepID=UPI0037095532